MKNEAKTLPTTYLLLLLVVNITLSFLAIGSFIPFPYNLTGLVFIFLGISINIWADNIFKTKKTTVKPYESPSILVTKGPFKISRHPMYLGFVLILLGLVVVMDNVFGSVTPIVMFLILDRNYIPKEERELEKTFGKRYLEYKTQVRRWL